MVQTQLKKILVNFIIHFFKIQLQTDSSFSFQLMKEVKDLLRNKNIIRSLSFRDKTSLHRTNYALKDTTDSFYNNFRQDFVSDITQRNGFKLCNIFRVVNFRNQSNELFI